ncbi:MAG: GNAT family N-acetyltransferase [Pseudomonadota bacterium]
MKAVVSALVPQDEARWRELWQSYLTWYRSGTLPADITDHLWRTVLAGNGPMYGLGARVADKLVGFTNFTFHASSWTKGEYCYLEDLYVDKTTRGSGAGRELIQAVRDKAKGRNASRLYWHTEVGNETARRLYDTLATEAGFVQYRMPLVD